MAKVSVFDLPLDIRTDEVFAIFGTYGSVTEVRIYRSRSNPENPFADVTYQTFDDAWVAVRTLNDVYKFREHSPNPIRLNTVFFQGGDGGSGGGVVSTEHINLRRFRNVNFSTYGTEQLCRFIDSRGESHPVCIYLPPPSPHLPDTDAEFGWPTVVYIHDDASRAPFFSACNMMSEGVQMMKRHFVVISPLLPGELKTPDLYFDTEAGLQSLSWVTELVCCAASVGPDGLSGWVDPDRLAVTGMSMGGCLAFLLGMACNGILCAIAPVASYHDEDRADELVQGLAYLPIYIVHSRSRTERTCPIEWERELWDRISKEGGGKIQVHEKVCKHGRTFSHAYEQNCELWDWLLLQRLSTRVQNF